MKTFTLTLAAAFVSCSAIAAQAGGWGKTSYTHVGHNQTSTGGLINVSPSLGLGDVNVLNGILNGSAILSGNNISGILNGNKTGNGILSGIGVGILGGNSILNNKSYRLGRH